MPVPRSSGSWCSACNHPEFLVRSGSQSERNHSFAPGETEHWWLLAKNGQHLDHCTSRLLSIWFWCSSREIPVSFDWALVQAVTRTLRVPHAIQVYTHMDNGLRTTQQHRHILHLYPLATENAAANQCGTTCETDELTRLGSHRSRLPR